MRTNKKLPECPHCGSDSGFYRKGTVSGTYQSNYTFEGDNADNTHIHDGVRYTEHKKCFCQDCNSEIKGLKLID